MTAPPNDRPLRRRDLPADPLALFRAWIDEALATVEIEPTAAALATAGDDGRPSCRFVLLRQWDERGFVFYTGYGSRKARELDANPHAALVLWWPELQRQVRIEGRSERVTDAESDAYFATRSPASRISAAASPQSRPLRDRAELERLVAEVGTRWPDGDVPRPAHWGGVRVVAAAIEFWQGRAHRRHDRFRYRLAGGGAWRIERLAP